MDNKKLILHFDARNTIFVSDFNSRLTMEEALNTYISGLVWGSVIDGTWHISHKGISTQCPDVSLISYYKHMEKNVVKCPADRQNLRQILGRFTEGIGNLFHPIFSDHLNLLRWTFEPNPDLTVKGNDGHSYHYILPTFFNTLAILYKKKRDFAIIIRTFGLDIPHILKAIKAFISGHHPLFQEKFEINLCDYENELLMTNEGYQYKYRRWNNDVVSVTNREDDIVEHWNSTDGIVAVKDDFNYWLQHDYSYKASKPLWINHRLNDSDKVYHHIFFDDCIRPRDNDSIVHLRKLLNEPTDNGMPESCIIELADIVSYSDVNIIQSDLLACIKDQKYFWEKIELCELNFPCSYDVL